MAVFTVHLPPETGDRLADAERAVFVPETFSWGAMIFGPLWLAAGRVWLGLVAWLAIVGVLSYAAGKLQPSSDLAPLVFVAIAIFLGFEGRELKRISLQHRGYRLADVVAGRSRSDAEQAFFARWLASPRPPEPVDVAPLPGGAPVPPPRSPVPGDVIGLFPEAGGRP